jgi:AcrR family transcriptional regulator
MIEKGQLRPICRVCDILFGGKMARPRKDAGIEPARLRIKEAFWALLPATDVRDVTVRELCRQAGCNRSTFYRNYCDVYELLAEVQRDVLPYELPALIRDSLLAGGMRQKMAIVNFVRHNRERLARMSLLLSPGGDPTFARTLKDAMLDAWTQAFGTTTAALSFESRVLMEFLLNGVLALLTYHDEKGRPVNLLKIAPFFSAEVAPSLVPMIERDMSR